MQVVASVEQVGRACRARRCGYGRCKWANSFVGMVESMQGQLVGAAENLRTGRACMGELVTHGSDFWTLQEAWADGFMTGVSTAGLGCRGG